MEHIIECNNLTHYYGKRLIYENLSFTVPKGRILGLLGKERYGQDHHYQYLERLPETPFRRMSHLRTGDTDNGTGICAAISDCSSKVMCNINS